MLFLLLLFSAGLAALERNVFVIIFVGTQIVLSFRIVVRIAVCVVTVIMGAVLPGDVLLARPF